MCHLRSRSRVLPVLVGPKIPRRDRSPEERERGCRALLILFKPWRTEADLRDPGESWSSAYARYRFPLHIQFVIQNIHLENECKDARDSYAEERRAGRVQAFFEDDDMRALLGGVDEWQEALHNDPRLDQALIFGPTDDTARSAGEARDRAIEERNSSHLDFLLDSLENAGIIDNNNSPSHGPLNNPMGVEDGLFPDVLIEDHRIEMEKFRKLRRPTTSRKRKRTAPHLPHRPCPGHAPPITYVDHVVRDEVWKRFPGWEALDFEDSSPAMAIIEKIANEMGIADNLEQKAAFELVGRHLLEKDPEQLMMYIAGEAGTGKSHVVRAIVELFVRLGLRAHILLGAPTGIAAILIGGHTVHALSYLPKSKYQSDLSALTELWSGVDYLIVDEISMVGARFLGQVSRRLASARPSGNTSEAPFGGVNFIALGDFGQLRPVKQKSLYSRDLIWGLDLNGAQTEEGQEALHGLNLWRQIRKVVKLTRNYRQAADPVYAGIVSRVRVGQATVKTDRSKTSDYERLLNRQLSLLTAQALRTPGGLSNLSRFRDCPIIVVNKRERDAINLRVAQTRARQAGHILRYYIAQDRIGGELTSGRFALDLLRVNSSATKDHLGVLPLFEGMKVMITENLDMSHKSVNGAEGTVAHIKHRVVDKQRVAVCVYVHVPGSDIRLEGLPQDVVPVFPSRKSYTYAAPDKSTHTISREQVPLLPAYAYTDYKGQGRSLDTVLVDIASSKTCQSLYVMLSRVKTLDGLAILRWFPQERISQSLSHELRDELARIDSLSTSTLHGRT